MSVANRASRSVSAKRCKFKLDLPPTTNASYRFHAGTMYTSIYWKQYQTDVQYLLLTLKGFFLTCPVSVEIVFHLKRDRDIDSGLKCLLDSLQLAKVFDNDKQVVRLSVAKVLDGKAATDVTVTSV